MNMKKVRMPKEVLVTEMTIEDAAGTDEVPMDLNPDDFIQK